MVDYGSATKKRCYEWMAERDDPWKGIMEDGLDDVETFHE